jgi:hypothetical protein
MDQSNACNNTQLHRREKVLVLLTKGLKGYQIANELGVNPATISRDIHFLSKESRNNLEFLAKETLPFMYQTSIEGIKTVLNECWNIYNNKDVENGVSWINKLSALKLAKECNESLFRLVAEGPSLIYLKELEERLEKVENNKKENT